MTATNRSQSQHEPLFPFASLPGMDAWRQAAEGCVQRLGALQDEYVRLEGTQVERARGAIDEGARLMRESLQYATQLSSEWRRLSADAARRTVEMMTPRP